MTRPVSPTRRARLVTTFAATVAAAFSLAGCATTRAEPPGPGYQRGGAIGLSGLRVMVLPVQLGGGTSGDLDREIGYALSARGEDVDWVLGEDLRLSAARNPGIQVDGLPVERFLAGDLIRIGDPLFGQIYRLGGLVGASYAVIPIRALATPVDAPRVQVELTAALVDTRTGLVAWFGIVAGRPGGVEDVYTAATAAEAMAARLLP